MTKVRLKKAVEPVRPSFLLNVSADALAMLIHFYHMTSFDNECLHAAGASARDCGQGDKHTF